MLMRSPCADFHQSPGLWYVPPAIWAQNRKSPRTHERVAVEFMPRQSTSAYVLMTERDSGSSARLRRDSAYSVGGSSQGVLPLFPTPTEPTISHSILRIRQFAAAGAR